MYRYHLTNFSNLKLNKHLSTLYATGLILAIATHVTTYINSSFIETFIGLHYTGLFFISANIITLLAMIFFPSIIKHWGNFRTIKIMLILGIISSLALITFSSPWLLLIFFIVMWASLSLVWINMDIFVESFTNNKNTGKIRAIFFTFINIGIILSPIISTSLVGKDNNYPVVYLFSTVVIIIFYLLLTFLKKRIDKKIVFKQQKIKQTIIDFWQDKNLKGLYAISFFLNLFFSVVVVYIPIYLHTVIGFDWSTLGILFAIILLPFILFEIPAGIIADKYLGEKEILFLALGILTICLFLFSYIDSNNPIVWGAVLFISRIGAALIEAMRESRFFKIVDATDVSYINFLRTSYPLGYLVGTSLGVIILSWSNIPNLFFYLSILFLFGFYFIYIIKDSK